MKHIRPSPATLAFLLGAASAVAQQPLTPKPTTPIEDQPAIAAPAASTGQKLGFMDRRFVTKASDNGTNELQLAQLASQRATNPEVRAFAEQLIADQSLANWELSRLAEQKSLKIDFDEGKDRAYRRLSAKSGSEFDQEFLAHILEERERDVKNFEHAARSAKDADVRTYAARQLDQLRQQLHNGQQLRTTIMPTGRDGSWSGRPDENKSKAKPDTSYPDSSTSKPNGAP